MSETYRVTDVNSLNGFINRVQSVCEGQEQVTFSWRVGKDMSDDQRRMTFELYSRIGEQLYGGDSLHARAECKLTLGVPIMRRDDVDYRAKYDMVIRPLDYDTKLSLMIPSLEFPVTSCMGIRQCREYIDTVIKVYTNKGVDFSAILNNPY